MARLGTSADLALPSGTGTTPAAGTPLHPVDRRIFVVAGGLFAVLMAFSSRYGFHRDELYFLDCARHLAASYVDQPIFGPLVTRLSLDLFGVSLTGLRMWPALAGAGTVVIGGLLAREFGGGRVAQLIGALGVATAPAVLGADHILNTTSFALLAWAALALVVVRIGRTGRTALWPLAGAICGLGLTNNHSIAFFAVAIVVGTLLSGGANGILNRSFALGMVITIAFTVPDLWWQATHGWPTIGMTRALAQENGGLTNAIAFVPSQLFMAAPVLIGVSLAGLRFLWRSSRPVWRGLAWSYGLLFVFFAATSGEKPYYLAATYFSLIAAGAVAVEERWTNDPSRARSMYAALAVSFVITAAIVLPVLPASRVGWTAQLDPVPTETVGWPELDHTVAGVWHGLTPVQRANGVIFTSNYGEAGAINELGGPDGLPLAVSGQNNVWYWGPGNPNATTVVVVVLKRPASYVRKFMDMLRRDFGQIRLAATLNDGHRLINMEQGGSVLICTDPVRRWGALWPSLKRYA